MVLDPLGILKDAETVYPLGPITSSGSVMVVDDDAAGGFSVTVAVADWAELEALVAVTVTVV